jgi:hypothetical protein
LKSRVKNYYFQTLASGQKAETDTMKNLTEDDFHSCYEAWEIRWTKCAASEGYYLEGDNVDLDEYLNKLFRANLSHYFVNTARKVLSSGI